MDYETLFLKYKEELIQANANLSFRKIYKSILKKIRYLFFATRTEKTTTIRNKKILEMDVFLEDMYQQNEKIENAMEKEQLRRPISEMILRMPYKKLPNGFNRKILAYKQKENMLDSYLILVEALVSILIDYYKKGNLIKDVFSILESLIEITMDTYIKEQENYDAYFKRIEMSIVNQEVPVLEQIDMYNDLINFITQILSNYEEFNFTKFQRELLKK